MAFNGTCPVCEANLKLKEDVEISEIVGCPDCNSLLVVEFMADHTVSLAQAPQIEEDWGQ